MFNIRNSVLIILCMTAFFTEQGLAQDYNRMQNEKRLYSSSETKVYTADGSVLSQSFGERKNTRSIVVSFPLIEPKDEKDGFHFTTAQVKGTAIRGIKSSAIKKIFLADTGFEITFDPSGITGPVDALIMIETESGLVRLKMTGTLTGVAPQ